VRRARSKRPELKVTVQRHPDADKLKSVELLLPKDLRLVKRRIRRGASANASAKLSRRSLSVRGARRLRISGLPSKGSNKLVVRLRRGAVRPTGKLRRALRRKRSRTLRVRVISTDTAGKQFTGRGSVRARR
jgi:hypothetical protein